MYYIGIDIGSTYIKSILLNMDSGKPEKQEKFASPAKIPYENPNYFEVPAEKIAEIVEQQIDGYTKEYQGVKGIILTTQMHGFVYKVSGRRDRYVSWQDMRCLDRMAGEDRTYMDFLQKKISREQMQKNGVYIKPSLGFCNLYTLLEEEHADRDGEVYTLGSYIIQRLTGNNICHITNAAPLGLVDVEKRQWDYEKLEMLGFTRMKFPELAGKDTQVCGIYESNGQKISVYPDFGDQQCAILGSMCEIGDAVINIATASQVSITMENFVPGAYETRPYFEGKYINTISNMPAGRNLDVLITFISKIIRDFTGKETAHAEIWEKIAGMYQQDSKGISVDTRFYSVPDKRDGGSISGITNSNLDVQTIISAAFLDMADTYWKNIRVLSGPMEIKRLVCAGGVSWKQPRLVETIQRVSERRCLLSAIPDETLSGIYRIALVCEGICTGLDDKREMVLKI